MGLINLPGRMYLLDAKIRHNFARAITISTKFLPGCNYAKQNLLQAVPHTTTLGTEDP